MINYETFHKIKHLHENVHLNVGQIAKEVGLSRPAVRRHLAKEKYEKPRRTKRSSKLDPYRDIIKRYLNQHEYTAVQIFRMIREDGYTGGISILREYIGLVRPSKQPAYLTLSFAPGESAQVDFGYCGTIQVGNVRRRLYVFAMTLCCSRMIYVEFILRQNMEHFLQCHRNAFEYFGGIPEKAMVDNCKVAVSSVSRYGDAVVNAHYADLASHYNFKVVPCSVRRPNEKGRVERTIGYLKKSFLNGLEKGTLTALNNNARYWMENIANTRIHGTTKKQPIELFKVEKEAMKALPLFPYDCCVAHSVRVNSQYRVVFETNRYSVPPELSRKQITVKVYPKKLLFMYQDKLVAEHERCYEKNKDTVDTEHDKALIKKRHLMKNRRLLERFFSLGEIAEKYDRGLNEKRNNPRRHIRQITALLDIYDVEEVKKAMEDTCELEVFSADAVLNVLEIRHRPLPEPTPLHLSRKTDSLDIELPEANLDIYNIK
jgi:transposase